MSKFVKTLKNKVAALTLIGAGLAILKLEGDATVLMFSTFFGGALFLEKEDCFD